MKTKYYKNIDQIKTLSYQRTYSTLVSTIIYRLITVIFILSLTVLAKAQVEINAIRCDVLSVNQTQMHYGSGGEEDFIEVATSNGCTSYTVSAPSWVTYSKNELSVFIRIQPNTGSARTGQINIGGKYVTIEQDGVCTPPTNIGIISGPVSVCEGQTNVDYYANFYNATSYVWNYSGYGVTVLQDANTVKLSFSTNAMSGDLTVYGVNSCGGRGPVNSTRITVHSLPYVSVSSNSPVCEGNAITFSSSGGIWTGPNNFSSTLSSPVIFDAKARHAGNYVLTTTDTYGCTNSATTTLVVNSKPILSPPTYTTNNTYGSSLTLHAPDGLAAYSWKGPTNFYATEQHPTVSNNYNLANGTFTLTATNSLGCSASSNIQITERCLDTSLPVGTTEAIFNVGNSGSAFYTVPVDVPPGTAGMQPGVSISYNSSAGEGNMGMGWSMNASSSITRVPADFYHDGLVDPVDFDSYDRFAINGNRLILISGIYGAAGSVYYTESETFVRITAMGTTGNGPLWFSVETKDGKILEFGNTTDSRYEAAGRADVLAWNLNKVTDANSNYMTYTYYNDKTVGVFRLQRIDYTGNATTGLAPYNSVHFLYEARSDVNIAYVYGTPLRNNYYLSKIETYNEIVKVKEFRFEYVYNKTLHLDKIIEYGAYREAFNAIQVNWNENGSSASINTGIPYTTNYITADFNGNGKYEIISLSPGYFKNRWFLEMNRFEMNSSSTDFEDLGASNLPALEMDQLQTGDFNGDGKTEVVAALSGSANSFQYYQFNGGGFSLSGAYGASVDAYPGIYAHDFNGDGIDDMLVRNVTTNALTVYWGDAGNPFATSTAISITWGDKQFFHDFNGDGKKDIMTVNSSGYFIYEWENIEFLATLSAALHTNNQDIFCGDYNGDGMTDFIYGKYIGGQLTDIKSCIATGAGFITTDFGYSIDASVNYLSAFDSDNDGKDELYTYKNYDFQSKEYHFNNGSYELLPGTDDVTFISGDFNGDGIMDYIQKGENMIVYCADNSKFRDMVSSIKDGLNKSYNITYKVSTDPTVYTPQNNGTYRKADYSVPFYLVAGVKTDNGLNGETETVYAYEGAKYDSQLRQFLGFMGVTRTSPVAGIVEKNEYTIDPGFNYTAPLKTTVKTVAGTLLSETSYVVSNRNYGNNRYWSYISQKNTTDFLYGEASVTSSFVYDDYGNLTSSVVNSGSLSSVTTTNTWVAAGTWCLSQPATTLSTAKRTGESNYTTNASFQYYTNGNLKQKIEEPGNAKQVYTNFTYNAYGNVTQVKTSPDGVTGRYINYEYDAASKGRMITKKLDSQGHFTEYTNSYQLGLISQTKDHNNMTTTFAYDEFGRLVKTTAPDNNTSSTTYAWATDNAPSYALLTRTVSISGKPYVKDYLDKLGRIVLTETIGFDGRKLYAETAYNAKGQVTYVTLPYYAGDSNSDRKSFTYDDYGRVKTETAPGVNIGYTYNGLSVTVTDHIKGVSTTRLANADGTLQKATDAGGDITYSYFANGLAKQISAPGGNNITMGYDQFGRQTSLTDPNAGTYTYDYNIYGELTSQTDPKSRITTNGYNDLGQPTSCNQGTFNTTYVYKTNGLPESVSATNNISYTYSYGDYLRPAATTENIEGTTLSTGYKYNTDGTVSKVTYPGGFAVTYHYENGYLEEIKRADTGRSIWKVNAINAKGQITQTTAGNRLVTTKTYNSNGYLTAINTGNGAIQNLEYHYNAKDLMDWRRDNRHSAITESFGYDALNRLNTITLNGVIKSINYSDNGNIQAKTDAGTYTYSATQPNAVERVSGNRATIGSLQQDVTYTTFNKVNSLTEGTSSATFTYGPDYARKKVVTTIEGTVTTRMYSGSYERETQGSITRELYYIVAGGEIVAIFEKKTGAADAMYYVYTDHLGSLNVITNQSGAIEQELSFDAWGNRRNPDTWVNLTGTPANLITRRGFTAHEHIDELGIINMNGRLYDPVLGRFLSPDPIIGDPGNTQSYNRYSYVVNNPLMFTDPSGYRTVPAFQYHSYLDDLGRKGGDGWGGFFWTSGSPHVSDVLGLNNSGSMGYKYLDGIGYMDVATGGSVDYQTAQAWAIETASKNKNDIAERYIVYETAYKNSKGEWVGNGNFGVIRAGIMEADPKYNLAVAQSQGGWDLDGDGILTLGEANNWYRNGNGQAITVDASRITFTTVNPKELSKKQPTAINFETRLEPISGLVYGSLEITLVGDNKVRIEPNQYDFTYGAQQGQPWFGSPGGFVRNVGTVLGNVVAGSGQPYMINFNGLATVNFLTIRPMFDPTMKF